MKLSSTEFQNLFADSTYLCPTYHGPTKHNGMSCSEEERKPIFSFLSNRRSFLFVFGALLCQPDVSPFKETVAPFLLFPRIPQVPLSLLVLTFFAH